MAKADLFLGCITGTSMDGLDLCLVEIDEGEHINVMQKQTKPLPQLLRQQLLTLALTGQDNLDVYGHADVDLGAFIGASILEFLQQNQISPAQITAIGSHGQTVRHRPSSNHEPGFTLQIGDANHIAESTGITTVADFRRRDMAADGQGAPLVPPFHQVLFHHVGKRGVILNIGGISNISILGNPPSGFDTGPGNCLMDSWCQQHQQEPYDKAGLWASTGQLDTTLLKQLLADDYFAAPAPKSTGREYFNLPWLQNHLPDAQQNAADVQATLCELTAMSIVQSVEQSAPQCTHLVVCGGGRLNRYLMTRLQQLCAAQVSISEQWQVDGDAIEAAAFAWLAYRTINGRSGNEPAVTGAKGYRVIGNIFPA